MAKSSKARHPVAITTALGAISLAGLAIFAVTDARVEELKNGAAEIGRLVQFAQAQPKHQQPAPATPAARTSAAAAAAPPAAAAPSAAPIRTETIVYDNWTVSCRDIVSDKVKKACSATFQMTSQERNAVIFTWLIGRNNEGALVSVMQVPTGIIIPRGVELKIGNGAVKKLSFVTCDQQRCEASIQMDDALTKEMTAAQAATATIFTPDGKGINFNMIPKGIDKAIGSIPR